MRRAALTQPRDDVKMTRSGCEAEKRLMTLCRGRGCGKGLREQESKRKRFFLCSQGARAAGPGHRSIPPSPPPLCREALFLQACQLRSTGQACGDPACSTDGELEQLRDSGLISSILGLGARPALDEGTQRPQGQSDGAVHGG